MSDLITVAIALYNTENEVARCIESVLNQTYKNIEVLVIDDGSIDRSYEIVSKFSDQRIHLIKKENGGLSSVRQYGLNIAAGKYISFIDADDYLEPTYVNNLYFQIKKNNADICVCSTLFIDDKNMEWISGLSQAYAINNECKLEITDQLLATNYYMLLCKYLMCDSWNKMYSIEFLRKTNTSFQTTKGLNGTDLAYNHKLLLHNPVICTWHAEEYIHVMYSKSAVHRKNKKLIKSVLEYIDQIILESKNINKYGILEKQISFVYVAALRDAFQDVYRELAGKSTEVDNTFKEIIIRHLDFKKARRISLALRQPTRSLTLFATLLKLKNVYILTAYFKYRSLKVHKL